MECKMPNTRKDLKFAVVGLPALERARFIVRPARGKGQGVFLRKGLSLEKGTHVMQYGGCASSKDPANEYTFKMKEDLFLDASKEKYLCSFFF
jgi:hypothetical protein